MTGRKTGRKGAPMVTQAEVDEVVRLKESKTSLAQIAEAMGGFITIARVKTILNAAGLLGPKTAEKYGDGDRAKLAKWLAGPDANGGEPVVDLTPDEKAIRDAVAANEAEGQKHEAKKVVRPVAKTELKIAAKAGAKPAAKRVRRKKS